MAESSLDAQKYCWFCHEAAQIIAESEGMEHEKMHQVCVTSFSAYAYQRLHHYEYSELFQTTIQVLSSNYHMSSFFSDYTDNFAFKRQSLA